MFCAILYSFMDSKIPILSRNVGIKLVRDPCPTLASFTSVHDCDPWLIGFRDSLKLLFIWLIGAYIRLSIGLEWENKRE